MKIPDLHVGVRFLDPPEILPDGDTLHSKQIWVAPVEFDTEQEAQDFILKLKEQNGN